MKKTNNIICLHGYTFHKDQVVAVGPVKTVYPDGCSDWRYGVQIYLKGAQINIVLPQPSQFKDNCRLSTQSHRQLYRDNADKQHQMIVSQVFGNINEPLYQY